MAFVCILSEDRGSYELARNGSARLITISVGYNDATKRSYSVRVALDRMAGGDWELTFCLSEYDSETDGIRDFFSGKDVAQLIARNDRALILAHVAASIQDLLRIVQPSLVYMCTFEPNLPQTAMRKYAIIEEVFTASGYAVHRQPDHHGQKIWWMERRSPSTIEELKR